MRKLLVMLAFVLVVPVSSLAECESKTVGLFVWDLGDILASPVGLDARKFLKEKAANPNPRDWDSFSIHYGPRLRKLRDEGRLRTSSVDFNVEIRGNGIPGGYRFERGKNGLMKTEFRVPNAVSIQELAFSFPDKEFRDSIVSPPEVGNEKERFLLGFTRVWERNCIVYLSIVRHAEAVK